MADAVVPPVVPPVVEPPAPPAKTGDEVPKTWDEIFKHPRFVELNTKAKTAQDALDAKKLADDQAEEQRKIKAGEHQLVIDDLKPKAARAKELEDALTTVVEAEIALIPKERQSLVPELPPEKKLAYITANRAFLMGDKKTNVNHKTNPADGSTSGGEKPTFTNAQIADSEFYEKNRVAIMEAARDGRIVD